jgi:NAD+ dependent glucose-6-phosphate dehydrogenase
VNVLLTGAAGRIGQALLPAFQQRYNLRALDRQPVPGDPRAVTADLTDLPALKTAMTDIEVVVHLAATPNEQPFLDQLVPNNIVGVHNIFQAAVENGVRRVVFASTVQTVLGYKNQRVEVTDPVRPSSIYGATKVFGEALGRFYHDQHNLEVLCARLGAFQPYDNLPRIAQKEWFAQLWLSPRDAIQFFTRAIEAQNISFGVVFVTSKTASEFFNLGAARDLLGYEPQDDVARERNKLNDIANPKESTPS